MKKILRSVAALLAVAVIASCFTMSAFAGASSGDAMTDAELSELLEMLEDQGVAVSGADVSGSDISASDVIAPVVKTFGQYELTEQRFDEYGVTISVPAFEQSGNIYSSADELGLLFGDTVSANALFDISYGGFTNYICYGTTSDGSSMMALTYTESNWSRFIGSFANLSAEEMERMESGSDLIGVGDGSTATFRVINGTPMLCQEYYDTAYMAKYYIVRTIVDGGMYELYMQLYNPTDADSTAADQIINSLDIDGFNVQRYGVASTRTTGWLIALVALLFAAVALLAFFIVRFSLFAKASGSSFNIIGFDLPGSDSDEDSYDDSDDDDED